MASTLKRIGDLDIHQDLAFQRRSWRLQRVGWGVLAVIALAGLLGLFGQGPFSRTTAADPSLPFSVEYDRFARFRSPMILRILLNEEHPPRAMLDVWVSRAYLDHVQITGITPPPLQTQISADGATYQFPVAAPPGGSITFHVESEQVGRLPASIGASPGQALSFTQWIHP